MVCDSSGYVSSAMSLSLFSLIGGSSCSYSVSSQDRISVVVGKPSNRLREQAMSSRNRNAEEDKQIIAAA